MARRKRARKGAHEGTFHSYYRTSHEAESAAIRHRFRDLAHTKGNDGTHNFDVTNRDDVRKFVQAPDFKHDVAHMEDMISFFGGEKGGGSAQPRRGRPPAAAKAPSKPSTATAPSKKSSGRKKKRIRRTGEELAAAKREVAIRKAVTKRLKMNKPGKRSPEDSARLEAEIKKELGKK